MDTRVSFKIAPQPTETTCGPTCLHAVYRYYGDDIALEQVIADIRPLREGGTLDAFLALHALKRGYQATIYTFNLNLFDPTWFNKKLTMPEIKTKLQEQLAVKSGPKLGIATKAYCEYIELGGRIRLADLSSTTLRRYLKRGKPILTGLSSTWLYRAPRELDNTAPDDVRGAPVGHFVVLHGYDPDKREVLIADPYVENPYTTPDLNYSVRMERLIAAVLLGVVTYDCNLLVIEPRVRTPS